jgi:hypothetical protein
LIDITAAAFARMRRLTLRRWLWILALSVAAGASFELFLGLVATYSRHIPIADGIPLWAVRGAIVGVPIVLLTQLLLALQISRRQAGYALR